MTKKTRRLAKHIASSLRPSTTTLRASDLTANPARAYTLGTIAR